MSAPTENRVHGDALLVGSLPFDTAAEAFEESARHLGDDVPALPDGEIGARRMWVAFLPRHVYSQHPDVVVISAEDAKRTTVKPGMTADNQSWRDKMSGWKFGIRPGTKDFRFDDLKYGAMAIESYADFKRLRDEGKIADTVRFQVCLPAPGSAVDGYFQAEDWERARKAYIEGLQNEVTKILEVVPAEDLAIQFDLAMEIVDLSIGDAINLEGWPQRTVEEKFAWHTAPLADLCRTVPDEALLGYHWCYGTFGGWPMCDMPDLQLCVDLSNEAVRSVRRLIDYLHMPVTQEQTEEFFAPLAQLETGDTKIYLGLIHQEDGIEGASRRIEYAHRYLDSFGVAAVCGYGRLDALELSSVLRLHHECAEGLMV